MIYDETSKANDHPKHTRKFRSSGFFPGGSRGAHTHENSTCGKLCSVSSLDRPMLFRACSNAVSYLCLQGPWRTESKRLSR